MRYLYVCLALLVGTGGVSIAQTTLPAGPTTRPVPAIQRVLIVSIDGLRPDLALRANAPTLRSLMQTGAFSFWARTTVMAITLPSHASMLTGVTPEKHGVTWNKEVSTTQPVVYCKAPTLFELAKARGYTTAMVAGKKKFETLARPGTLDWQFMPENPKIGDKQVAEEAIAVIKSHHPQVMAVHLPETDAVGHSAGWGTPQQILTIENADGYLGAILAAMKDAGTFDETLVIVSADHGGQGRAHGKDDFRSRHIPWIISGPGVRKGYDLTRVAELTVNTEDTFATACYVLAIPLPGQSDGKPILAAFEEPAQLLINTTQPAVDKP